MKEDLLKIVNTYGIMYQLKYFQSEVFELNEAIIRAENQPEPVKDIDHIAEEIADCLVMINQFIQYYNINQIDVYTIMKEKIERQIERIEKANLTN